MKHLIDINQSIASLEFYSVHFSTKYSKQLEMIHKAIHNDKLKVIGDMYTWCHHFASALDILLSSQVEIIDKRMLFNHIKNEHIVLQEAQKCLNEYITHINGSVKRLEGIINSDFRATALQHTTTQKPWDSFRTAYNNSKVKLKIMVAQIRRLQVLVKNILTHFESINQRMRTIKRFLLMPCLTRDAFLQIFRRLYDGLVDYQDFYIIQATAIELSC